MIKVRTCKKEDMNLINKFWNETVSVDGFYKEIANYQEKLEAIPGFSYDGMFIALDDEKIVGLGIGILKNKEQGAINALLVNHSYRHQKIGNALLENLEKYFLEHDVKTVFVYGYLPSCYEWYVPNTKCDHPCAPGVRLNSDEYFFFLHHGYGISVQQDAFCLKLSDYELSPDIKKILDENKKDGITIEFYDEKKHEGLEEFIEKLNIYDFEKVIRENLLLKEPYPFLVVVKDNKIKGWTGALWNEKSGRGHFDGIAILEESRGRGLGKALFATLAYQSKLNNAKFMTFYTGLNNHARYIYMGAGFKIVQSFGVLKKELRKR